MTSNNDSCNPVTFFVVLLLFGFGVFLGFNLADYLGMIFPNLKTGSQDDPITFTFKVLIIPLIIATLFCFTVFFVYEQFKSKIKNHNKP